MKKSGYKYQIKQELQRRDWEIIEIDSDAAWWDDEHWKIQLRFDPNITFYLCFIADPQFEETVKKGRGVCEILASTKFPGNWNDFENRIGSISMAKRKFDVKLMAFMEKLDDFKKEKLLPKKTK